jgi:AraC-like DNA-binding protein
MSFTHEERSSESPYIEKVMHGWTVSSGSQVRPSEVHWHLVFSRYEGRWHPIFVGPLTSSGKVTYGAGAEILWIQFRLGTFMPHLPPRNFLDTETTLPGAESHSFWLKGSARQFPDYENVETFVDRLVREEVLVHDPVVNDILQGHPQALASRTVRYRFLRATGLTQLHIFQAERTQKAEELLHRGLSILDTVYEAGYYDQPHMTRSLKRYLGYTPARLIQSGLPEDDVYSRNEDLNQDRQEVFHAS